MKKIELLSPAKNLECGMAAINHGADAVYIGASRFGARKSAGNSMADIEKLVKYGKKFNVDIYLALNTILLDPELEEAEKTAREAWNAGVGALIVQDMAFMEMNLPGIRFFASTQTDNRTSEKVLFLEKAGFDRVILARELYIDEIKKIRDATTVELEAFVHGAVCYSYSGRCYLSAYIGGRSANRGECGQPCRLKWDLENTAGDKIIRDRHLLSLKDMNRSDYLEDLVNAGVTSFKIEGRLKDADYVKNITAFYRKKLDLLIEGRKELGPSSSGRTFFFFEPDPYRTFNRGLHSFFREKDSVFSINTPKSTGKSIGFVKKLNGNFIEIETSEKISNGDGICFINDDGTLSGFQVERSEGSKINPSSEIKGIIKKGTELFRNRDHVFLKLLSSGKTSERKIGLDIIFNEITSGFRLSAKDEDGIQAEVYSGSEKIPAEKPETALKNIEIQLSKLGDSIFYKKNIVIESAPYFISLKILNQMRRELVSEMEKGREKAFHDDRPEKIKTIDLFEYHDRKPDFSANISNHKAREFYLKHGVTEIDPGFETSLGKNGGTTEDRQKFFLMHSRHCILKGSRLCRKNQESGNNDFFYIQHDNRRFKVVHDCINCEMYVIISRQTP